MADEIKQKLIFDITDFKNSINDMNRGIRIAQYNFKAAAGALGDWRKSYEGIETRIKSLTDVMGLQQAKVDALTKEYDDLESSGKASEGALKKLQEQISRANADLGKTTGELKDAQEQQDRFGKETEDSTQELDRFSDKTEDAGRKTGRFTNVLKDAASVLKSGIKASAKAVAASMAAIGAAAGAAIVGIYKLAGEASNLQESQNVVREVFKESGDEINQWTSTLATSAGISQTSATKMVGTMGAMLKSMTGNEKAAEDMSKELVQLAGDMASFYNLDAEEAFAKLRSGISGETEPLKQLGIVMSVANLEAFALAEGMGKSYKQMSESEKTLLRYNFIMQQTADAQGDFARTSDGLANSQRIMQLEFENMKTTLGSMFIPVVTQAVQTASGLLGRINEALADGFQPDDVRVIGEEISKVLMDGIKQVSKYLPEAIDTIAAVITELVDVIVELVPVLLPALMNGAMDLIQGFIDTIQANIGPITELAILLVTQFAEFVLKNLPLIIEMGAELIVSLIKGIANQLPELAPMMLEVINTLVRVMTENLPMLLDLGLKTIVSLALGIAQAIPELIPVIVQTVTSIIDVLVANLPMIVDAAILIILALVDGLIAALPQLIAWLPVIVNSLVDGIIKALPQISNAAIKIIMALVNALIDNLPMLLKATVEIMMALGRGLVAYVGEWVSYVPRLFSELVGAFIKMDWGKIGRDIINGIGTGITNAAGNLAKAARDAANKALSDVKNFLGINSPSTLFRDEVGVNMGLGVAEGIKATTSDVTDSMKDVTDKLKGDVQIDKNVTFTGTQAAPASGGAILQIQNFYNNTDKDIETLAYEFEFARQKAASALGV